MRKEPTALTFDDFADEVMRENQPRTLIILCSAKLDTQLREILEAFLLPTPGKSGQSDELFDGDSALGTFSSRIKVCRRLGLIDDSLATTLDALRGVRNQAAHWVSFGLTEMPLRDQLRSLRQRIERCRSYKLTVSRFFDTQTLTELERLQAVLLTLCAVVQAVRLDVENKSLSKSAKPVKFV
jgi:hypothetical protein